MATLGTRAAIASASILLALTCLAAAVAGATPVSAVNTADGLALKGYDPVAYFTTGRATAGRAEYAHRWKGATYHFASADNRDRFKAAPETYAPQYGGYCAYAMSINRIADVDPARWSIVGGKLYLNNNRLVHVLWSANKGGHIASADQHWAAYPRTGDAE